MKTAFKVFVIEDDATICQNLVFFLTKEGFDVQFTLSSEAALKTLMDHIFDIIILDINMPKMSGFELCQAFRKFNQITPIVMLTAYDEIDDKIRGFDLGADDYLTKPFFMEELSLRVKSLLKRSKNLQAVDEIIKISDLTINLSNKKAFRAAIEINLTAREFNLLVMLARSKGNIVTKKELNRSIWGGSLDENNNTIEVYINFLRKKVDKPFSKQLIKTKIGFGYYLEES
jgi:DNA-binding response OmpR family regulator